MAKILVKNPYKLLLVVLLLSAGLVACDPQEPCVTLATNRLKAGFFALNAAGEPALLTVSFDTVRVLGTDSLLLNRQASFNALNLHLNPGADTTTFIFESGQDMDTLQLGYVRNFRLISPACGPEVRFTDPRVVYHTFDSVSVLAIELFKNTEGLDLEIYP